MTELTEQLNNLKIARYEIRLEALSQAVLNAFIGSALRGAFGHSLKAIACSVSHQDCGRCILKTVCVYPQIFEPTAPKMQNAPRPFIFEPPIPPLTKALSKDEKMKLGVEKGGEISFGLTIIGDAIEKLPYFIYATELFAKHGLGVERTPFQVANVCVRDLHNDRYRIYQPQDETIEPHSEFNYTLRDLMQNRLENNNLNGSNLKLKFLTPLRIIRKRHLLTELTFSDIFKQASLRLKHLTDIYGEQLEYDYKDLMKKAEKVKIRKQNLWRHKYKRWTNRQNTKLELDGMLGEIEFAAENFAEFLPFLILGEILHIGSASSFGLGKYKILD